ILPGFSQEDMEIIDAVGFALKHRPPVVFQHDEHNELAQIEDCSECHHVYEDGKKLEDESSEDQSCSECHAENASGRQPGLRKAFHLNCKGCHLENNKGPIMCGQCHVRQN
ncbi:MAG: cytochrome c3 family protein, partial [Deltaproteobacteria bacterium]|nr:cytochrome c3 family protein [Deltaproteobacteria bacterium]